MSEWRLSVDLSLKCKPLPMQCCTLRHGNLHKFWFSIHKNQHLFSQHVRIWKCIYSACSHSLFMFICRRLMIALFRVGSCVSVESFDGLQLNSLKCSCFRCNECLQTLWLSLPGPPAVCTQPGHCHFESELHRTSWWPSGSNFLRHLSPQVL